MKIIIRYLLIFLGFVLALAACQNGDKIDHSGTVHPDDIYFDYRITAEEGKSIVTVILQYRLEDAEGPSFALTSPNKVTFDEVEIQPDSANLTGAFYEVVKPIEEFKGSHIIAFTVGKRGLYKFTMFC